jgi:ribonuclease HII
MIDDPRQASLTELRAALAGAKGRGLKALLLALEDDPRAGARELARKTLNRLEWRRAELRRLRRLTAHESTLIEQGFRLIAGADEAGRGALAGPLVAAAVILAPGERIVGVNDSKKLPPWQREALYRTITETAVAWSVVEIGQEEIDALGVQRANLRALMEAVLGLHVQPDYLLSDYFKIDAAGVPCLALVKGDAVSQTVAAASIIAKVHRDRLMQAHDTAYPAYGFKLNKGYATADHISSLRREGPCLLHRRSFLSDDTAGGQISLFSDQASF